MPEMVTFGQFAPEWLRIEDFCKLFGMSRRAYSRMRASGNGPAITWVHGKQLILKSSCDE